MSDEEEKMATSASDANPQTYYAAERTLLAWVRTGLAMMGFGFVVARFGLFLKEFASLQSRIPANQHGISITVGVSLVFLGVVVNLGAGIRHWHTIRRLHKRLPIRFHPISFGALIAFIVGLMGLVTAFYLLFGTGATSQ